MLAVLTFLCVSSSCLCKVTYDFHVEGNSLNGYYISVHVGSPPQNINLLVDTGSSNLAITTVPIRNTGFKYFMYNESISFQPSNTKIHLHYVVGEWDGFLALDVLNPCSNEDCSVICNISCMTFVHDVFDEGSQFQGILGLAYPSIAKPNVNVSPFLDTFIKKKNLPNVFALFLCGPYYSSNENTTKCGKFHVGFYSQSDIQDKILYTPILHEWYYEVALTNIKIGNVSVPIPCENLNKNHSIIDSGTSNLNLPHDVYYWAISEIQNYVNELLDITILNHTMICTQKDSLNASIFPNLTLSFYHSKTVSFDLIISPNLYLIPLSDSSTCAMLGIGVSDYGTVIGSTIMKGYYIIFDRENKRIGFAKPSFVPHSGFISDISELKISNADFDQCLRIEDANLSQLAILGLCLLFILACVLLFSLLLWIKKRHCEQFERDNCSDTSSLVDNHFTHVYVP